jgi:hypothetical protein
MTEFRTGSPIFGRRLSWVRTSIVNAADNDRPFGIAVDEPHPHRLARTRQELAAGLPAGPSLGDTHPADVVAGFEWRIRRTDAADPICNHFASDRLPS